MIYFGVDPGKSGAIAALDDEDEMMMVDWIPLSETAADVVAWVRSRATGNTRALLERVASSPQMGVKSAFTFGQSYGACEMLLVSLRIPFERITPVKWQTAMQCRSRGDKNVTKRRAQELYPNVRVTHTNADAILLAHALWSSSSC